jgi:hypothetical protein
MTFTGQCRCAAVHYQLELDRMPAVYACHCLNCQRWSGSAFGLHALLPQSALHSHGPLAEYTYEEAGQVSVQRVCAQCHTRLYNTTSAAPGMLVLRASTLDAASELSPLAHIWTRRKQAWVVLAEGVPSWPESPTPEQFARAVFAG